MAASAGVLVALGGRAVEPPPGFVDSIWPVLPEDLHAKAGFCHGVALLCAEPEVMRGLLKPLVSFQQLEKAELRARVTFVRGHAV
mmetsp:Transcript_30222/g.98085  ORF Transcript_30222/g.98085 Transcript_30222/m.98085 type:complete len:85 (+) Transcript_30222:48-302(+)